MILARHERQDASFRARARSRAALLPPPPPPRPPPPAPTGINSSRVFCVSGINNRWRRGGSEQRLTEIPSRIGRAEIKIRYPAVLQCLLGTAAARGIAKRIISYAKRIIISNIANNRYDWISDNVKNRDRDVQSRDRPSTRSADPNTLNLSNCRFGIVTLSGPHSFVYRSRCLSSVSRNGIIIARIQFRDPTETMDH